MIVGLDIDKEEVHHLIYKEGDIIGSTLIGLIGTIADRDAADDWKLI